MGRRYGDAVRSSPSRIWLAASMLSKGPCLMGWYELTSLSLPLVSLMRSSISLPLVRGTQTSCTSTRKTRVAGLSRGSKTITAMSTPERSFGRRQKRCSGAWRETKIARELQSGDLQDGRCRRSVIWSSSTCSTMECPRFTRND